MGKERKGNVEAFRKEGMGRGEKREKEGGETLEKIGKREKADGKREGREKKIIRNGI